MNSILSNEITQYTLYTTQCDKKKIRNWKNTLMIAKQENGEVLLTLSQKVLK